MIRKTFAQILKEAKIDIKAEYQRLYELFYVSEENIIDEGFDIFGKPSLENLINSNFISHPLRDTCTSLDDFNRTHGFCFEESPKKFDLNYLISFCEYIYNLVYYSDCKKREILKQIGLVIEKVGYMEVKEDNCFIFVPKSQPAICVAEILPTNLSYKVIEYNHHSMKGNLKKKRSILLLLADRLEAQRDELKKIDNQLQSDIFYLLNNVNIRHNNNEKGSKNYKAALSTFSEETIEKWYDYTYDLMLLAFIEMDNADHKTRVMELKKLLGDL